MDINLAKWRGAIEDSADGYNFLRKKYPHLSVEQMAKIMVETCPLSPDEIATGLVVATMMIAEGRVT